MDNEVLVYDGMQSCPYLEGRVARMPLYRQMRCLDLQTSDQRFARSERRVGASLYRTTCPTCVECEGIRVLVPEFRPSRSQRRVQKRWKDNWHLETGPARYSDEKLALFNKHKRQRGLADLSDEPMSAKGYVSWLLHSCMPTQEMRYYVHDRLIGVGIMDLGLTSASSVYFFFDPDPEISRLSPGVFSVLQEIDFCRRTGRDQLYLGLYIADCTHMNYKAGYCPNERLVDGDWRRFD